MRSPSGHPMHPSRSRLLLPYEFHQPRVPPTPRQSEHRPRPCKPRLAGRQIRRPGNGLILYLYRLIARRHPRHTSSLQLYPFANCILHRLARHHPPSHFRHIAGRTNPQAPPLISRTLCRVWGKAGTHKLTRLGRISRSLPGNGEQLTMKSLDHWQDLISACSWRCAL